MQSAGVEIHGEADFVGSFEPSTVLDAGCGTGRVAIELARRGADVVGVDLDPGMLDAARHKAPDLRWIETDLVDLDLGRRFDVVVMAGNVMIFVRPGTESAVVASLAGHLAHGGMLVAGFQLRPGGLDLATYDTHCRDAGLELVERYATWDRQPFEGNTGETENDETVGGYAVSVHQSAPPTIGAAMDLEPATIKHYLRHAFGGIEHVLDRLDDDTVNVRPDGWGTNSVAGLVVHCCALSVSWFEMPGLGRESERDRDAEFVATATVAQLRSQIADTVARLDPLVDEFCTGPTATDHEFRMFLPGEDHSDAALVLHVFEELFQHLGHMEVTADAVS